MYRPHDTSQLDQLWLDGLEAYERGEKMRAGAAWSAAAADDCADALLGLHALEPDNSPLLREIYRHIDNFGHERERLQRGLASLYYPGGFQAVALVSPDDLRCALALYESRCGDQDHALELLDACDAGAYPALTHLRILFENERYQDCLEQLSDRTLSLPAAHRPELELIHGACLLATGDIRSAILLLDNACTWLAHDRSDDLRLHLFYYLASAYKAIGDEPRSTELLVQIFDHDQKFADVSAQLTGDDPAWTRIVAQLEHGQPATDLH